ncbi:MAG: hypothetical protein P1Q69_20515 [Candidatus Thorarchaeota archaeon]|nr:hypothetical protein [Candidatus Thorarchaeota archaeon]
MSQGTMKRVMGILVLLLLLPIPASAVVYETVSFETDGVIVFVDVEANTPWASPFTENVNLSISVVPQIENSVQINITSVSLILYSMDADQTGYNLIAAEVKSGAPLASGVDQANYTHEFAMTGTSGGLDCFFAILVNGAYSNVTARHVFQALSAENLVGPFAIATGIASPQAWVGLIVIGISTIVMIAGVYGVKMSRTRSRRKTLLDE